MRNLAEYPLTATEAAGVMRAIAAEITALHADPINAPIGDIRPLILEWAASRLLALELHYEITRPALPITD